MQRKVLIIVENLPVPFDTRVWQEATTLAENGYEVSVICPKGKGYDKEYELMKGVNDIVQLGNITGCNPPDDIYMVAKWFKRKGVDYVFDHHDICPELFEAKFGKAKGLLYKSQLWLERQTYKHCTFAFVTNESYKKIAIERGGMKEEDVFVLRSGPKLERLRITPAKPEIKRGRRYMVGYLGVIGQQEGIEYLLEAAKYIRDELHRDDIFWGIVGGGPHLEALRKQSHAMGLDDIVEFTGRVPDDTLLDYLNTADVCVNSDEYNAMNDKSTMNKILEYMALGKPIVQFDLTEGRYSAQEASLYAEPNNARDMADKIVLLLEDEAMRKRMSEYGRNRIINELSWEHTSKALLEGYERYFSSRNL